MINLLIARVPSFYRQTNILASVFFDAKGPSTALAIAAGRNIARATRFTSATVARSSLLMRSSGVSSSFRNIHCFPYQSAWNDESSNASVSFPRTWSFARRSSSAVTPEETTFFNSALMVVRASLTRFLSSQAMMAKIPVSSSAWREEARGRQVLVTEGQTVERHADLYLFGLLVLERERLREAFRKIEDLERAVARERRLFHGPECLLKKTKHAGLNFSGDRDGETRRNVVRVSIRDQFLARHGSDDIPRTRDVPAERRVGE